MKKRLRKKLRLKEYAEYGVDMDLKILSYMGDEEFDTLTGRTCSVTKRN